MSDRDAGVRWSRRRGWVVGPVLACAAMSQLVVAADGDVQGSLEEIVVTAQKRQQRLQDVPVSVSAIGGERLEKSGFEGILDYSSFVPGMYYQEESFGGRSGPNIILRGVSNTRLRGTSGLTSSTTGFYLDDVPILTVNPKLIDIDRIEVLKGPQGTLYGAASLGGTVKIFLREPELNEYEGMLKADLSSTKDGGIGRGLSGIVNVPLVEDKLAVRAIAYHQQDPGWVDNRNPGLAANRLRGTFANAADVMRFNEELIQGAANVRKDTNTDTVTGARVGLLYQPLEALTVNASVYWQESERADSSTYDYNLPFAFTRERYQPEDEYEQFVQSSLEIGYDFGPVDFVSITGYYRRDSWQNEDRTSDLFNRKNGAANAFAAIEIPASALLTNETGSKILTHEFRLQSSAGATSGLLGKVDWVLGAFYLDEERTVDQFWISPGWNGNPVAGVGLIDDPNDVFLIAPLDQPAEDRSVFADVTLHLTDMLSVAAGVRRFDLKQGWERDIYGELQGNPNTWVHQSLPSEEHGWTPRFNISFQPADDLLFFAGMSEGFRGGGGNTNPSNQPACAQAIVEQNLQTFADTYKSDSIVHYEVGVKSSWLNRRLVVNGGAYYIEWSDLQQLIRLQQFNPGCSSNLTGNVGTATIEGFELEVTALTLDALELAATVSYSKARLEDPEIGPGQPNDRLQNVPDWTYSASAQYSFDLFADSEGYLRADWVHIGSRSAILGYSPNFWLRANDHVNLRLGVERGNWQGQLYVENVTNEDERLSSDAHPGEDQTLRSVTFRPLSVGLTLTRKF